MSRNFARFVGQFEIQNPIILDGLTFSVPLVTGDLHISGGGIEYKGEAGIFWPSLSLLQAV